MQVQDLGGSLHQQAAGVGQRQLGGAGEQLHIQLLLHVADVVAQGLLGDEQALGGPGDVQLLRHKQEILQMQKIHRGSFQKLHDILRFFVGSLPVYHNEKVVATISKNLLFGT